MSTGYATTVVMVAGTVMFCLGWLLGWYLGYRRRTEEVDADLGQLAETVVKTGVDTVRVATLMHGFRERGLIR